jgi:hypothetical protein
MNKLETPRDRDLPPGHLEARRDHLIREVRASIESGRHRLRFRPIGNTRPFVVSAAVLIAIAVGTFVAIDRMSSGTEPAAAAVKVTVSSSNSSKHVLVNVSRAIQTRMQNGEAEIVGGTAEQRDLLQTILSRMPDNSLTRVSIVPMTRMGEVGAALDIAVLPGDLPRSDWERMLLSSAFRALSAERGLTPVVGLPSQQAGYSPTGDTAAAIEAKIRAAAAATAAEVVQLQIYQPDGIAPAVILKVGDPGAFLEHRAQAFLNAIGNRWFDYEGTFIEVVDNDGGFVWSTGTNSLASETSVGTRPDLSGCNPISTHGLIPPPCPE